MDVTHINNITESTLIQPGNRPGTPSGSGFQEALDSALIQESEESAGSEKSAALAEPQPSHFPPSFSGDCASELTRRTDTVLTLLESYAEGLENPDTTLKDLSSMVEQIREEADQLLISAQENASAGDELKEIATQTALTATVEYVKFQRGDYL